MLQAQLNAYPIAGLNNVMVISPSWAVIKLKVK